ncbi:RnfH family protein [Aquirhabdus parva]|uniref:RnfH family protein n=2 Tax=Aquirhabdus parva TaxID=2283318 RepID=A0A345P3M7_9GAMM|nr:RnfH family protein [Aquirhabdus parva]
MEQSEDTPVIQVTLAWVNQEGKPEVRALQVVAGTTAAALFRQCNVFPENKTLPAMGIFSHKITDPEHYVMRNGDRLELYQPLILSPMAVRRARARAYPVGRLKLRP